MRVTVVIAAYNRAGQIGRAVRSALAQSHADLEVIVVDDGSADGTAEAATAAAAGDARLRVERLPENGGASAARNRGVELAAGELAMVWDSDDELYPAAIERLAGEFAAHPEIATASAPARFLRDGAPLPGQELGESGEVSLAGVLCKSQVGNDEKVRLSRAAALRRAPYRSRHLDFLVNVGLAEQGPWRRVAEFLGDVHVGDRAGSLTAARRKPSPARSAERAPILDAFVSRHGAAMRASCRGRLAAHERGAASGYLLGGDRAAARRLAWAAAKDDPASARAWGTLALALLPGGSWLARRVVGWAAR